MTTTNPHGARIGARIALVADRSANVRSHTRIPLLVEALREREHLELDAYWVPTPDAAEPGALAGFDGIWLLPGSPYESEEGALAAVGTARTAGIPFLGTCAGFQHMLLEYARSVAGLAGVAHGEAEPEAAEQLIAPLACSLVGHEGAVNLTPGSLAERLLGGNRTTERYHCSYGLNPSYLDTLAAHGIAFTGVDDAGDVRVAELPGHPFFLATLFQPELAGDGSRPHPFVAAFARAAVLRAGMDQKVPTAV
ncbi:hypothetical protein ORV05_11215 [Amycolatopsis cynarae]|uniref:CTP synthase (glutamine hydrolyzing) n=1 Tax=Amycolatopsis cynarae TaxID=2995223 RepID=A0ABY7B839_9PSEU|nr:hypothetical protein [Amycolatopsis sp. HUAS 11-8]WAL68301.1 hypothetical protein ORV05_11215 [Amycolatopsis sp. HUAS 11-8]